MKETKARVGEWFLFESSVGNLPEQFLQILMPRLIEAQSGSVKKKYKKGHLMEIKTLNYQSFLLEIWHFTQVTHQGHITGT